MPPSAHPLAHGVPHGGAAPASAAAAPRPPTARKEGRGGNALELIIDKAVDFALIFVGLYAATAVQRCQDTAKEKQEYISLLRDFRGEIGANLEQEASIERDLGAIELTEPGKNLGPMQATFKHFFEELGEDEKIVQCMHAEFVVVHADEQPHSPPGCHALYSQFDSSHREHDDAEPDSFSFEPAVLTPFYRREVWQLYLADGVKTFRNKDLAVRIAEIYANADLVEEQIADIEDTYNEAFMPQVGRTAATDMELAEIVHDEETQHGLSPADMTLLLHVDEAIKEEHYAALEVERTLELKVERMKKTVLLLRSEIEQVQGAIDEELEVQRAKPDDE
ncbi:MAG: hypothetical protein K0V04_05745 [Deltaproteobacteria bacterium]|nr:hypothetical protein [Deltaproteobacteria bacterium]